MNESPLVSNRLLEAAMAFGAACISSCGAGTAAVVSGGSGGGGDNAAPVLSSFRVEHARVSPARPRFLLADQESNPATVEFFYELPGAAREPITKLTGISGNSATLATSAEGIEHTLEWNFTAEPALPDDGRFIDGVRVFATVRGGIQEIVLGANAEVLGLGNDPPEIEDVEAPSAPEVSGITALRLDVRDSSRDVVAIKVEYDVVGDEPDSMWQLARPAGISSGARTPEFAFPGVEAPSNGVDLVFFWDTESDLNDLERDVRVRFTPEDDVVEGTSGVTPAFRVDNNQEPIADLDSGLLIANPDARRGIPIPYRVTDAENDAVDVVLQWRRANEDFPALPSDPAAIAAIAADPEGRRAFQIASPFPERFSGRVAPVDASSVRLYELGTSALGLFHDRLEGREIEILRGSLVPKRVASGWSANPLSRPVCALPLGDGQEVVVLDRVGVGSWRLRILRLCTGEVVRELVANTAGDPSAMAFEPDARAVLVASDVGGAWRVTRVDLASAGATVVAAAGGAPPQGRIRGIAVVSSTSALITVGGALVRLHYADLLDPKVITLIQGLATPWGVVLDPLSENSAYVAERDWTAPGVQVPGRILRIDLDTLAREPVRTLVGDPAEGTFPRPEALAITRGGARLIAICNPKFALRSVSAVDLGGHQSNLLFDLSYGLSTNVSSVTTGPEGLLIAALPNEDDLAVGGGLIQRRTISSYEPARHLATVAAPFDPEPSPSDRWRISRTSRSIALGSSSTSGVFVWDSGDVPGGGAVFFRATPIDSEVGLASETAAPKQVAGGRWTSEQLVVPAGTVVPRSLTSGDMNADGRVDLACSGSQGILLYFQVSPGEFSPTPLQLVPVGGLAPRAMTAVDLDGDGDLDLAFVDVGGSFGICLQTSPGVFDPNPLVVSGGGGGSNCSIQVADLEPDGDLDLVASGDLTHRVTVSLQTSPGVFAPPHVLTSVDMGFPREVDVCDLDADGDLDLATANRASNNVTVFFQLRAGTFDAVPAVLGDETSIRTPASIAASDLDRDGDAELFCRSFSNSIVAAFAQIGPGVFDPIPLRIATSPTSTSGRVLAADVDGDGLRDVVSGDSHGGASIYFQRPAGVVDSAPLPLEGTMNSGPFQALTAADLNGDGALDLASLGDSTAIVLAIQTGTGVFASSPSGIDALSEFMIDIEGDGDLDLVHQVGLSMSVQLQQSPGFFESAFFAIPWNDKGVVLEQIADLDGDGKADLVLSSAVDDSVVLLFQSSTGMFDPNAVVLGDTAARDAFTECVTGDMDGDGDLDLIAANSGPDTLTIYFQTSPRAFDPTPLTLGGPATTRDPAYAHVADLDADGDQDLVAISSSLQTLTVFFQTAPGVFGPTPLVLGNAGLTPIPVSIQTVDFDSDGDLDLACATFGGDYVRVFVQTAPGVFGAQPLALGGPEVTHFAATLQAVDLDGDGDQDLVAGSSSFGHLALLFQDSPGVFRASTTLIEGFGSVNGAADVDGDGDIDLLVDGNEVLWGAH